MNASDVTTTRDKDGKFLPGQSGNPNGRPKGRKNQITELKQDLEIAVRRNVPASRIGKIVGKMCDLAEEGHVGAAKLILDKTLSNAKDAEDAQEAQGGFTFVVKNVTLQNVRDTVEADGGQIIDVTPQEET